MNRQIIIRGAAIAFAGVAASVFAAQQFLDLGGSASQNAGMPNPDQQVMGASLIGSNAPAPAAQAPAQPPALALQLQGSPVGSTDQTAGTAQIAALDDGLAPDQVTLPVGDFQPPLTLAQATPSANDASCLPSLSATAAIDALVDLRLSAPCAPNTRIVISHDDLAFSTFTDADGELALYVPALTQTAMFEAFLPDQTVLTAQAIVPEVSQHVRVVVQWTGAEYIALHAYHRGANFGEAGHIHAARPFDPSADAAFVLAMGTARGPEPMLANVYSVPLSMTDMARTEVEFSVNAQTCGRDLSAFVSLKWPGMTSALEEMRVAMPDCSAAGGTAVLPLPLRSGGVSQASMVQTLGQN